MKTLLKIIAINYCLLAPFLLIENLNKIDLNLFLRQESYIISCLLCIELLFFNYRRYQEKNSIFRAIDLVISTILLVTAFSFANYSLTKFTLWTIISYSFFRSILLIKHHEKPMRFLSLTCLSFMQFSVIGQNHHLAVLCSMMFASFVYPIFFYDFEHKDSFSKILFFLSAIIANFLIGHYLIDKMYVLLNLPIIFFFYFKEFNSKRSVLYSSLTVIIMIIIAVLSNIEKL